MTVYEAMEDALALLPDSGGAKADYAVRWCNLALAECFDTENSIRLAKGRPELETIPSVSAPRDEIPYSDSIVRRALPYFFASLAAKDDGDGFAMSEYRARFVIALSECAKLLPGRVKDVYGGDPPCRG